jgi:hypothetical protein
MAAPPIRIPASDWTDITMALAKPWPQEAIQADLEWWMHAPTKRPGRQVLAKRWGWTEGRARKVIGRFTPLEASWCSWCGGNGGAVERPCSRCDGTGQTWSRR